MMAPLLEIDAVSKFYTLRKQRITALNRVNLRMESDEPKIIALAGESGSGKSTLANLILGFTEPDEGAIRFNGADLSEKSAAELKRYRQDVQAVFQDPFGVFNPFYRVRHVFDLAFRNFMADVSKSDRADSIEHALSSVGLRGTDVLHKYPHQLSGGQRQRIMMARACVMQPKLVVADEPVSMVDASLRAAILDVMIRMRDEQGIAFLYITHDLATAFQVCDELLLLYQGSVMEQGVPSQVIGDPKHPYSKLLVGSIPATQYSQDWVNAPIDKSVDESHQTGAGCGFAPRCPLSKEKRCQSEIPILREWSESTNKAERYVACHFHEKL